MDKNEAARMENSVIRSPSLEEKVTTVDKLVNPSQCAVCGKPFISLPPQYDPRCRECYEPGIGYARLLPHEFTLADFSLGDSQRARKNESSTQEDPNDCSK